MIPVSSNISNPVVETPIVFSNADPGRLPKKPPELRGSQLKTMDDLFEEPVKIVSKFGLHLADLSLKEIVDWVQEILKNNPELGVLEDVVVIGGKVSQILNLEDKRNALALLKDLNLPENYPYFSSKNQRLIPDIDVRFILKGSNGEKRLKLALELERKFVKSVCKRIPNADLQMIISTFFTDFCKPDETDIPNGNRFLIMGMGNRKDYGFELMFIENLKRQEIFSPEVKISYLHKRFYAESEKDMQWLWQGLSDRLTGRLHVRELETLDAIGWYKLISYYNQGYGLAPGLEELTLVNKGQPCSAEGVKDFILKHHMLDLTDRLAYMLHCALSLSRNGLAQNFSVLAPIFLNSLLEGDVTELACYGISSADVEQLLAQWILDSNTEIFKCGYHLLIQCARLNPKKSLKPLLRHLPKYCANTTQENFLKLLNPIFGEKASDLQKLFSEAKWSEFLLTNPLWETEGYELWQETIYANMSEQALDELVKAIFPQHHLNGLKVFQFIKNPTSLLAIRIASKFLDADFLSEFQVQHLFSICAERLCQSLIEGNQSHLVLQLIKKYPDLFKLKLALLKSLCLQISIEERTHLRRSERREVTDSQNWLFASGVQIADWIDNHVRNQEWNEVSNLIQDLNVEGMIAEFKEEIYPALRRWIEAILRSPTTQYHLWFLTRIGTILDNHPGLYDRVGLFQVNQQLLEITSVGYAETGVIGYVGQMNNILEKLTEDLLFFSKATNPPEAFLRAIDALETTLGTIIYEPYRLSQRTVKNLTNLAPYIMENLQKQGKGEMILELTVAYQKRRSEGVVLQLLPSIVEAWLYACHSKLKGEGLSLGEKQYLAQIVSKLPQLKTLYPPGQEKPLYDSICNILGNLFTTETQLSLNIYMAVLKERPQLVENYSHVAMSALETFVADGQTKEAYNFLRSPPVLASNDEVRKAKMAEKIVEQALTTKKGEIPLQELLNLLTQYQCKNQSVWASLLTAYRVIGPSKESKSQIENCWKAYLINGEDKATAVASQRMDCWTIGIAALSDVSSSILFDYAEDLKTLQQIFKDAEGRSQWIDTFLILAKNTLPRLPGHLLKREVLEGMYVYLASIRGECESPSRLELYYEIRYRLIGLKGCLPEIKDFVIATYLLNDDLIGDLELSEKALEGKRKHLGYAVNTLFGQLDRFKPKDLPALKSLQRLNGGAVSSIVEGKSVPALEALQKLIETLMHVSPTYYDCYLVIDKMKNFPLVNMNFLAGMFFIKIVKDYPQSIQQLMKKFTSEMLLDLFEKIVNYPQLNYYMEKYDLYEAIAHTLENKFVVPVFKREHRSICWEKFLKATFKWDVPNPKEQLLAISALFDVILLQCKNYMLQEEFYLKIREILKRFLREGALKEFINLNHLYLKSYLLVSCKQNVLEEQSDAIQGNIPHQTFSNISSRINCLNILLKNKKSHEIGPYLVKECQLLRLAFDIYKEERMNVSQKALILDHALGKILILTKFASKNEEFNQALEKIIYDYFYLVDPRERILFTGHVVHTNDCISSASILVCGEVDGYFHTRRRLFAELLFFLRCNSTTKWAMSSNESKLKNDELAVGFTKSIRTILELYPSYESNVYALNIFISGMENVNFRNYSFLPEIVDILSSILGQVAFVESGGKTILSRFLKIPYLSLMCPEGANKAERLPQVKAIAGHLFTILLSLHLMTARPSLDMRHVIFNVFDLLEDLRDNYLQEYDKDYYNSLNVMFDTVICYLKRGDIAENDRVDGLTRYLRLCLAIKLPCKAMESERKKLISNFMQNPVVARIQPPIQFKSLFVLINNVLK